MGQRLLARVSYFTEMTFSIVQTLIFYYNFLLWNSLNLTSYFENNTGFLRTFHPASPKCFKYFSQKYLKNHSTFSNLGNWHWYSSINSSADLIQILQVFTWTLYFLCTVLRNFITCINWRKHYRNRFHKNLFAVDLNFWKLQIEIDQSRVTFLAYSNLL